MVDYSQEELLAKWEEFFEEQEYHSRILSLADEYPETRSLEVRFEDLDRYDTDFGMYLLRRPQTSIAAGEETIRRLIPPTDEAVRVHLRLKGLPRESRVQIRDLRSKHLGTYIAVEGLVRKATEVRPKLTDASFRCARCGTVIKMPQENTVLHEPLECYEDQSGCKRSASATKFALINEGSVFLDTQQIEAQEAPEGLRGGEEPRRLSAHVDDDLVGFAMPGDRVVLNGILRSYQRVRPGLKSTLFDIFMEINSMEMEQVEYEEIKILDEDIEEIRREAEDPDIFRHIVASIAPSIYGLEVEKEALSLQLFGGVPKQMPDGRRIRGDIHILLVGDPGCLVGDERVVLGNGTVAKLRDLGQSHLQRIRTQVRLGTGGYRNGWTARFHRYENQPILEVVTDSGKCIRGTYNHPLLVWNPDKMCGEWRRLDELQVGDKLRVSPSIKCWKRALVPTEWEGPTYYHDSWHVKTPEFVDEPLAAILGYIIGDGWVQQRRVGYVVAEGELDLSTKIDRLFKDVFDVKPNRQARRGKVFYFQVDRTPVARWLRHLNVKRIPDVIFQSRNSVASTFLRWLYEADGTCFAGGRGRTAISLRSASLELLRDVQVLLLRWGIHSSILWSDAPKPHTVRGGLVRGGPSGTLIIRRGNSILRFAKNIGFESRKKRGRILQVVKYIESRKRRWHGQLSEKIVSIRKDGRAAVYDIEVPRHHRFIANGIISHNTAKSELLSYMAKLSPRGILATGRAASAAGLTAAAIRSEEFGEGRWTLEAGALVLADKGLACIDEMDKMNPQDRSAIHEALEQQRVSVAKAGITAVLQARCAVLGAANPKFGRFDEHKYVSEQIDMPPTLLSRFDIIFSMIDRPQAEYDRNLADHIIRGHLAGEMMTKREHGESVPASGASDDAFRPFFKPDFFRKYVAFAKRIFPILSPEAMDTLKEQYLDIRKGGEMEGSAVPITPRQLEAYVRLAEASARARLSPIVSADDAARAVRIVEYWLSRVSGEGGRVDIDIITTGVSHSQREQMIVLRDILRELAGEDGTADMEDIVQLAEQRGIPAAQAEKILRRWKEEGEVYTPTEGKFRVVTRL